MIGWEDLAEFSPRSSVRAKKLTEFGVWNRTPRNRIRPVSWKIFGCAPKERRRRHAEKRLSKSKCWFSGRGGMRTAKLFSFQSPAVQWMARTSSLNCRPSCRNLYQTPDSLNCLPPFHWKPLFFTEKCFVASPSPKSALKKVFHWKVLRRIPFPKIGSETPFVSLKSASSHPLPQNRLWKNKHLGADIHDPKARTLMDFQTLGGGVGQGPLQAPLWLFLDFSKAGQLLTPVAGRQDPNPS